MMQRTRGHAGSTRRSFYLSMRDGVRLAVDVHLPAAAAHRLPTILHQTRYFRSVSLRRGLDLRALRKLIDPILETRERFLAAGYAWVDVCVRGSGASFGTRPCPWAPDEIADGAEIVDWIIAQPWSTGLVGSTGISYSGTTAELLLVNNHPAVRAVAPRYSLFDVYADIAFPGGIPFRWFTKAWSRFNNLLDADDVATAFAMVMRLSARGWGQVEGRRRSRLYRGLDGPVYEAAIRTFVNVIARGVSAVDGDQDRQLLREAGAEHLDNFNVHTGAIQATYRDDLNMTPRRPGEGMDAFSPHTLVDHRAEDGPAVLSVSGWLDGAYQASAIKRFSTLPKGRRALVIGPWDHGGGQDTSPFNRNLKADFDHDTDLLDFFDRHLRPESGQLAEAAPVRYFTLGAERWQTAETWPPPHLETLTLHLAGERTLGGPEPRAEAGVDSYHVEHDLGTGDRARWNSLLGLQAPIGYPDQAPRCRRMLTWTGPALSRDLEVTGEPVVRLWLDATDTDAAVFVYLLDVSPSGRVEYITEGQLRARHRYLCTTPGPYPTSIGWRSFERADARPLTPREPVELVIALLPTSWQLARGHRLRLALAGADADHFAPITRTEPVLRVHHGAAHPSRLELPTAPGGLGAPSLP